MRPKIMIQSYLSIKVITSICNTCIFCHQTKKGPFRTPCFHNERKGNRPATCVPEPVSRQSGMVSGQNRRQKMRGVAGLGLLNNGIALRHTLKAVNGLRDTAEKGTGQKKNAEETRHIRNLLNSGRGLWGFAHV